MNMRIATWNLERPTKSEMQRLYALTAQMKSVNADVWILTETSSLASPGEDFVPVATEAIQGEIKYDEGENRTTIWSRLPIIEVIRSQDHETTVAAIVESPFGPILVYGTIIPYHAAGGRWPYRFGGANVTGKKQWELHYEAIQFHAQTIANLHQKYPGCHFCFGGDLNQSRDGRSWPWNRQWYGTQRGRDELSALLSSNGMRCVTEDNFFDTGQLNSRSMVDHLCLDNELAALVTKAEPWEAGICALGKPITDHSGICVDLQAEHAS
jgi:hypothetical protein